MYANGTGVPQDYVAAHMWFNLSAAQGNAKAVEDRNNVATKMASAQIAEAQRLARDWTATPN
jgi:TPR repeat protein